MNEKQEGFGILDGELPGLKDENNRRDGHQRIELFLSCRKLRNRDLLSLSDPQIKVFAEVGGKIKFVGETEIIQDNLNPDFTTTFTMDYIFEVKQPLRFEIIDIDSKDGKFDPLGEVHTTLGDIMGSRNQVAILDIKLNNKPAGKLIIRAEIIDGSPSYVNMEFQGEKIKNIAGIFSKINPFFSLARAIGENSTVKVYQSEVIRKSTDPKWKRFEISMQTLCNNDQHRPIIIEVSSQKGMSRKVIGECITTIHQIQKENKREFVLTDPKSKDKKVGKIKLNYYSVLQKPTFLEYLRSGIQLNVMIAIDFTQSNGNPKSMNSLHAIRKDGVLNDYQKAIQGVCEILLCYDYDKKVPIFGFGGKPQGATDVHHCFSLTGSESEPYADGLDGIMEVYKNALETTKLSGPTYFKYILKRGMDYAFEEKIKGSQVYTILLILTDGMIHDMQPTIDGLVDCAELPLSVIIVGVGNEDFTNMKKLDADEEPLCNSRGVKMKRDLVQFVPFNDFKGDREKLAEEVLAEVPTQFLEYMKSQSKLPEAKSDFDFTKLITQTTLRDASPVNAIFRHSTPGELDTRLSHGFSINVNKVSGTEPLEEFKDDIVPEEKKGTHSIIKLNTSPERLEKHHSTLDGKQRGLNMREGEYRHSLDSSRHSDDPDRINGRRISNGSSEDNIFDPRNLAN